MRAYIPGYELVRPRTLREALGRMAGEPGVWRPFAGGTDLMVLLQAGKLDHRRFLRIWELQELRGIAIASDSVTLGCLTTYTEVLRDETSRHEFPLLAAAAAETGGIATQNRGTHALEAGLYQLRFDTSTRSPFFPEVVIRFRVEDTGQHYPTDEPHGVIESVLTRT
jgi:molybdopterin-dependent oxidoreductase-like protein